VASGERIAIGSIGIGCLVLALKGMAWWVTGSVAFYSDALETTLHLATGLLVLMSVRLAARPADANHPFGHSKAEFFAAVIEGVLIVIAALSIFNQAWHAWLHPEPLQVPSEGIGINAVATVLNGGWALALLRAGRGLNSPALEADGRHLLSDVVTSLGIVAGVLVSVLTGYLPLDSLIAAAAGVYVLWSGMRMISSSVGGLMDAAPGPEVIGRIRQLVGDSATGALEAHDLRTRRAGRLTFLDFHLVVPADMTVAESHAICDRIEEALRAEMPHVAVTIHVEPPDKAKQHGVPVL